VVATTSSRRLIHYREEPGVGSILGSAAAHELRHIGSACIGRGICATLRLVNCGWSVNCTRRDRLVDGDDSDCHYAAASAQTCTDALAFAAARRLRMRSR
jgi:hypothetical protein